MVTYPSYPRCTSMEDHYCEGTSTFPSPLTMNRCPEVDLGHQGMPPSPHLSASWPRMAAMDLGSPSATPRRLQKPEIQQQIQQSIRTRPLTGDVDGRARFPCNYCLKSSDYLLATIQSQVICQKVAKHFDSSGGAT